jgi:hypothetical protein
VHCHRNICGLKNRIQFDLLRWSRTFEWRSCLLSCRVLAVRLRYTGTRHVNRPRVSDSSTVCTLAKIPHLGQPPCNGITVCHESVMSSTTSRPVPLPEDYRHQPQLALDCPGCATACFWLPPGRLSHATVPGLSTYRMWSWSPASWTAPAGLPQPLPALDRPATARPGLLDLVSPSLTVPALNVSRNQKTNLCISEPRSLWALPYRKRWCMLCRPNPAPGAQCALAYRSPNLSAKHHTQSLGTNVTGSATYLRSARRQTRVAVN